MSRTFWAQLPQRLSIRSCEPQRNALAEEKFCSEGCASVCETSSSFLAKMRRMKRRIRMLPPLRLSRGCLEEERHCRLFELIPSGVAVAGSRSARASQRCAIARCVTQSFASGAFIRPSDTPWTGKVRCASSATRRGKLWIALAWRPQGSRSSATVAAAVKNCSVALARAACTCAVPPGLGAAARPARMTVFCAEGAVDLRCAMIACFVTCPVRVGSVAPHVAHVWVSSARIANAGRTWRFVRCAMAVGTLLAALTTF